MNNSYFTVIFILNLATQRPMMEYYGTNPQYSTMKNTSISFGGILLIDKV